MRFGEYLTQVCFRQFDTVIYGKKYVFGLHLPFWHRAPKTLVIILSDKRDKGIFCYVNEATFGPPLGNLRESTP